MEELIAKNFERLKPAIEEYYLLSIQKELSAEQEERMDEILQMSENNNVLSCIINEIDSILGIRMGLFEPTYVEKYKDQISWMKEYLLLPSREEEKKYCCNIQALLHIIGIYNGPSDGLFSSKTLEAIQEFQARANLLIDGVPGQDFCEMLISEIENSSMLGG